MLVLMRFLLSTALLLLLHTSHENAYFAVASDARGSGSADSLAVSDHGHLPRMFHPGTAVLGDQQTSIDNNTLAYVAPVLEISSPANHSWWQVAADSLTLRELTISFTTRSAFHVPRDGYLIVTGEKVPRGGLRYADSASSIVITHLEPGSYFFELALRTWDHRSVSGGSAMLHVEVVVPQQRAQRVWKYALQEAEKKPVVLVNLPGSQRRSKRLKQGKALSSEAPAPPPPIPVCYCTSMAGTIDGQMKMWLQLMEALGPNALRTSNQPAFAFQVKAYEDLQGETTKKRALRARNISLYENPMTISAQEALEHGLTQSNVFEFLLEQLLAAFPYARDSASAITAHEAARLHTIESTVAVRYWTNLTASLETCRDGILLFANARSASDRVLVYGARLAGVRSVVMELASLRPELLEVDAVLAPSHFAASHPSVIQAVRFNRVYVHSTGVDTNVFVPPTRNLSRTSETSYFVIGYVGRLHVEKSVGLVLEMAKAVALSCPLCRFRVLGNGPLEAHLKALADAWGLLGVVDFVSGIYDDDARLARALQEMDVYFSPCFFETLGIAALEAMSVGVPVIGFQTGGTSEYLVDGYNGIALEDPSPTTFRLAVKRLQRDRELRARMGENARRTVLERFSLQHSVAKYVTLYERLV